VQVLIWSGVILVALAGWSTLAIIRSEQINSVWFIVTALSSFAIAYRFYAKYIQVKLLQPDDQRETPAVRLNNSIDYHPTDRRILFGHHFAAIAGAGPLVGPILAAQMGYLPSTLWIIFGVIFAGCVQDMLTLFISMRRSAKTIRQMAYDKVGRFAAGVFGIFMMMMLAICFSFLALVCVNAMAESPWAVFSISCTIPIALFMGCYQKFLRPGKVLEVSAIGVVLMLAAIVGGGYISVSELAPTLTLSPLALSVGLIIYGATAASLPVWLLLTPRDYLSTFMKIGTVGLLAIGILVVHPMIQMPDFTRFAFSTDGPVFSGNLFPFLFITVACGALSGAHSLFCSGTTPKMIEKESHVRLIGYGAMLTEAFVAIIALVAAITLSQGVYFSMNMSEASIKAVAGANYLPTGTREDNAVAAIDNLNVQSIDGQAANVTWVNENDELLTGSDALKALADDMGEHSVVSRTGGAPTLAVGMANILHKLVGGRHLLDFWYHFAIMFEALFILSSLDAGTRVMKLQVQEFIANFGGRRARKFGADGAKSGVGGLISTAVSVLFWGTLLVMGVTDPNGGVRVMMPLFGISNQLLAGCALAILTYLVILKGKLRYAAIPGVPAVFALTVTLTAGFQKIFSPDLAVGYFALRNSTLDAISSGRIAADALDTAEVTVRNSTIQGVLMVIFVLVVLIFLSVLLYRAVRAVRSKSYDLNVY
jgi:carbon starvation protein